MPESLSPHRVRERIESSEPIAVLDVRESLDYVRGHVRECTWVPRRDLERRLAELVPNRATPVVLCDNDGERGEIDARWMEKLGYEDVSYVDGGVEAWRRKGFELVEAKEHVHATAFNYESKEFGEEVDAGLDLPKIGPDELASRLDELTVVDVRNPAEYEKWGTIPGSINVEGVDLALYANELRNEGRPMVVHCAGRTRSIIGTATLRKLGVSNVYELENGTMGWQLAGYDLTEGAGELEGTSRDAGQHQQLRDSAEQLLHERDIPFVSPSEIRQLRASVDDRQSIYRFDVRTEGEYARGHLPGTVSVPGGQLIQTAGRHIAVRDGVIVLVSESHFRSAITAYWLDVMGFSNVHVLRGGTTAWAENGNQLTTDTIDTLPVDETIDEEVDHVPAPELWEMVNGDSVTIVNLDRSEAYEDRHVPGAKWVPRCDIESAVDEGLLGNDGLLVLSCEDGTVSTSAALQMRTVFGIEDVSVLRGGLTEWQTSGLPVENGGDGFVIEPRRAMRKPYGQGMAEMEIYLDWEENLVDT